MSKVKNEVAVKEEYTNLLPTHLSDFEEDAGKGIATGGAAEFAIPFLQIAQTNSPQINKRDGKYIEGLSSGDIFNSVTLEFAEHFTVVPVYHERLFIEWEPRGAASKAPVGRYLPTDPVVVKAEEKPRGPKGELYSGNGQNTLIDTRYHYVLVVREDGTFYPALIGLSSTGTTVSRRWNSLMDSVKNPSTGNTLPSFCRKYKYRSVPKTNDKGTWNLADFSFGDFLPSRTAPLYVAAKKFFEDAQKGNVKVDDSGISNQDSDSHVDLGDVEDNGVI